MNVVSMIPFGDNEASSKRDRRSLLTITNSCADRVTLFTMRGLTEGRPCYQYQRISPSLNNRTMHHTLSLRSLSSPVIHVSRALLISLVRLLCVLPSVSKRIRSDVLARTGTD